jgi:hypothetical protein
VSRSGRAHRRLGQKGFVIYYFKGGEYDKVLNGKYPVSGKNADGSLRIGEGEEGAEIRDRP